MNRYLLFRMRLRNLAAIVRLLAVGSAVLALCYALPAAAQQENQLLDRLGTYHFGGDPQLPDAVDAWVHSSLSHADARREVAHSLAQFLGPQFPFDVRQLVCRELVLVATPHEIPALIPLLHDPRLAPYACLVLERIPSAQVDQALLRQVPSLSGEALIAVLDAFAARRTVAAIPYAAKLLSSDDEEVAYAAATALAWIGGVRAADILRGALRTGSPGTRRLAAHALLTLADRERSQGHRQLAIVCYRTLLSVHGDDALAASVLRGSALMAGSRAVPMLLHALQTGSKRVQQVAASTLGEVPGSDATRAICAALPKLGPAARSLAIEAIARRRDRSAQAAIAAQISSHDPAVRTAAIRALGRIGDASAVRVLLKCAATGSPADREAAAESLTQLRDDRVDAELVSLAKESLGEMRLAAIRALAERSATTAIPWLIQAVSDRDLRVVAASARALRSLAGPAQLGVLIDLMARTTPARAEVLADTVADLARRCPNRDLPIALLERSFRTTRDPAKRSLLLGALASLGGDKPLAVLRAALHDTDADVRSTAVRLLAEWQTSEPAGDLLALAQSAPDAATRAVALRGFVHMVAQDVSLPPPTALARYREALALARSADERRQVLSGIARVRSRDALMLAASFLSDAQVRPEAEAAVVQIAACTAGVWPEDTRGVLSQIANSSNNEEIKKRAADLLQVMNRFGDFDMAWEVSPAYFREGAEFTRLFDMPFPPEEPSADRQVPWQLMPMGGNPDQPWLLDLLALWGGDQRVAYLRTEVWCDASRDLVLSVGSDDGVKAWWNGEVVLAQNVARAVSPDQNRVTVHARAGWNLLMLKITQNIMGWGACARFLDPDGSPAQGLRFSVPSAVSQGR